MTEEITEQLCRSYNIVCPACNIENRHPRLKRDVYRAKEQEPDGHPLELTWQAQGEIPEWVTPLHYFWGTCSRCFYTAQMDDPDFRQWQKNSKKYLSQYAEGELEKASQGANAGTGPLQVLGKGIQPGDAFGAPILKFYLGVFTETMKAAPVAGNLARFYLRIAWLYRDEGRLFQPFAESSGVRDLLNDTASTWSDALLPNDAYPVTPAIVTDEVGALRFALAYFEWNFLSLQKAGNEEEMRLMMLLGDIGFRIYQLTNDGEDFKKGQNLYSGCMQKCLSIANDKSIVGGAVNRAKETLDKVGDRGRELRSLRDRREKGLAPIPDPQAPAPPAPKAEAEPEPQAEDAAEPQADEETASTEAAPQATPDEAPSGGPSNVQALQDKIKQLGEENKRWMRLAGISEVTGLPNRVMVAKVLLPGALKEAAGRREPLGCILISPEGLAEINSKYGRAKGDILLNKFSECLKALLRRGERLSHLQGVDFALLVPTMPFHQLRRRAEALHKELTSRRFDLDGEVLSVRVSMGAAGFDALSKGNSSQALQQALYSRSVQALDVAKVKGNCIEIHEDHSPSL